MSEEKAPISSRNMKGNLILKGHNSVAFSQINSSKYLSIFRNKKEEETDDCYKEATNLRSTKTDRVSNENLKKMSPHHSYTIESPDSNKLKYNNKNEFLEGTSSKEDSKKKDTSSNNKSKNEKDSPRRSTHKNIISFFSSMTPQYKMLPKRTNSINVYFTKLKNSKINQKKLGIMHKGSLNIQKYNFKGYMRKNATLKEPLDNDKANLYLKNLYALKLKKKTQRIVNHLQIPDEDKIFDEMKKYLCYKYESKRLKTFTYKKIQEEKKDINKKLELKLKKLKPKLKSSDKKRLNYLYLATNKLSTKIYNVKTKKNNKDLNSYQNNLLEIVKPSLTDYSYMYLKDRLFAIRKKNEKKYQNNYKKLKEIESEEKEILNQFNETCENFVKQMKKKKDEPNMFFLGNLNIKLPTLNFISCLKKNKTEYNNNQSRKKKNKIKVKNLKLNKK